MRSVRFRDQSWVWKARTHALLQDPCDHFHSDFLCKALKPRHAKPIELAPSCGLPRHPDDTPTIYIRAVFLICRLMQSGVGRSFRKCRTRIGKSPKGGRRAALGRRATAAAGTAAFTAKPWPSLPERRSHPVPQPEERAELRRRPGRSFAVQANDDAVSHARRAAGQRRRLERRVDRCQVRVGDFPSTWPTSGLPTIRTLSIRRCEEQ
jgi:hypothetical protein